MNDYKPRSKIKELSNNGEIETSHNQNVIKLKHSILLRNGRKLGDVDFLELNTPYIVFYSKLQSLCYKLGKQTLLHIFSNKLIGLN